MQIARLVSLEPPYSVSPARRRDLSQVSLFLSLSPAERTKANELAAGRGAGSRL